MCLRSRRSARQQLLLQMNEDSYLFGPTTAMMQSKIYLQIYTSLKRFWSVCQFQKDTRLMEPASFWQISYSAFKQLISSMLVDPLWYLLKAASTSIRQGYTKLMEIIIDVCFSGSSWSKQGRKEPPRFGIKNELCIAGMRQWQYQTSLF